MINAKVGDKVVCVDAKRAPTTTIETGLKEGEVYTIRTIGMHRHYIDGDFLGVRLAEIDRGDDPSDFADNDMPFRASRFRPLVEPKAPARKVEREKVEEGV